MTDLMGDGLGAPQIVDRSTFDAELDALRVREKAHTREGDAIAAARRRLPMVEVDGATPLIGEGGPVTFTGWPQQCSYTRTNGGPPAWAPLSVWPGGRPIPHWHRLKAGFSDDLRTGRR